MKKLTSILFSLLMLTSCGTSKTNKLEINSADVVKVEVYRGFPGSQVQMKDGFTAAFLNDLNKSKDVGPHKYMKTHRILIFHENGKTDTISTNGTLHTFHGQNGWFESEINLISEYSMPFEGQLQTAEKLRNYMDTKNYDAAIELFSIEKQADLKKIRKDEKIFGFWSSAWTFDDAKFERYSELIKNGKAPFVYENNEWKIDEK